MRFICNHCQTRQEVDGIDLMIINMQGQPERVGTALKCPDCGKWTTAQDDKKEEERKNQDWLKGYSNF